MLFLGIDTATRIGSVGVVRAALAAAEVPVAGPGRIAEQAEVVAEVSRDTGRGHGAELIALVDECLLAADVALDDIGCVAVSSGPGSFTGLRVALATAKGLSFAGDIPLIGVPTLEALAATSVAGWLPGERPAALPPPGAPIAVCLDARKGEIYAAIFTVREPVWQEPASRLRRLSNDAAHAPSAFADELRAIVAAQPGERRRVFLLGDGPQRYAELIESLGDGATALPFEQFHPRGSCIARLGAAYLAAGRVHDRATLVPQYARASEAELVRQRRGAPG